MKAYPIEIVPGVRTECHDAPVARQYDFAADAWLMVCGSCGAHAGSPGPLDVMRLICDAWVDEVMRRG